MVTIIHSGHVPRDLGGTELVPYGATPEAKASARLVLAGVAVQTPGDLDEQAELLYDVLDALGLLPRRRTTPGVCACGCGQRLSMTSVAAGHHVRPACRARQREAS